MIAANVDRWPESNQWLLTKLERFHAVFGPRVKSLSLPSTANV
jgi:hypothetical protein